MAQPSPAWDRLQEGRLGAGEAALVVESPDPPTD